jgi:hypothetical protein
MGRATMGHAHVILVGMEWTANHVVPAQLHLGFGDIPEWNLPMPS